MGLEEFGGRGRRSFGGIEGILGGRRSFLGGGSKDFWEVEGVLGGSEEFWGSRRSFGGVGGVLGEATGVWGDGRWSLGGLGGGWGITWFSGETEGGSVVANRVKRGDCRKLTARE